MRIQDLFLSHHKLTLMSYFNIKRVRGSQSELENKVFKDCLPIRGLIDNIQQIIDALKNI